MARRGAPEYEPRTYLVSPDEFGQVETPAYRSPVDSEDAARLMASLAQHNAAFVIRRPRDAGELTFTEVADYTGGNYGFASGQLNGRYPADSVTIYHGALATDDVSVLAVFDTLEPFRT